MVGLRQLELREFHELPPWFFETPVTELARVAGGPALFHLKGAQSPPLFISVLLHGNEWTGVLAVRDWLKALAARNRPLPRDVILFVGNVEAAALNERRLADGPDFNRIWRSPPPAVAPLVHRILDILRSVRPFAVVDIHNNTGKNPAYACVSQWEHRHLHLALLFGRLVVFAEQPTTTFAYAASALCPSVTLECGRSGEASGVAKAVEYLDACAHLSAFPTRPVLSQDIEGYRTMARIGVLDGVSISFGNEPPSVTDTIVFRADLDSLNFRELPAGTVIGFASSLEGIFVQDKDGAPVDCLSLEQGRILTTRPLVPAMLSVSPVAVRYDCLGYVMERLQAPR
ncbi:MAG: succinylglutamate desuccinylase/aspartoacylase family protein [Bdellovibrionales bacterium]|nr:succinylglutamate desuccinylase/aspartoacylase family protein [Bdellovibrionales bacterium]